MSVSRFGLITHHSLLITALASFLNDFNHAPTLTRRQRTGLDDFHDVAHVDAEFIMRHEFFTTTNVAFVLRVANLTFDTNDYGLGHLVAGHQTYLLLPSAFGDGSRSLTKGNALLF